MSMTTPSASPEQQSASSPSQHDSSMLSQSLLSPGDENPAQGAEMEKHPKGKRKRTAAKDKMILEEAYRSNPKPDKQARQEVVDRVSLNEKEVQIWFQNRRQNDRRKSRPLSPEELAALRFGGMHHVPSSDPVTSRLDSDRCFPSSDPASSRSAADHQGSVSPPSTTTQTRPELTRSYSDAAIVTPRNGGVGRHVDAIPPQSQEVPSSQRSRDSESMGHSFSSSVGYLANRWNLGSSFSSPSTFGRGGDDSTRLESLPSSASSSETHSQSKSQSNVRLSLSLEGKAELISSHASPTRPSPPRTPTSTDASGPQPRQRTGLSRSQSALPSITLPPISALTNSLPPRLARGRSRDVQAWESCADSERRDELTTQAENESNGSAIAAISLLRSSSGILQPSSAKRNASLSRPQQQRQAKKARLSRTTSTSARLQSIDDDAEKKDASGKVNVSMLISPTDSDKENWSPDEDGNTNSHHRRRPLPASPSTKTQNPRRLGRILQDHKGPAMLSNRSQTAPSPMSSKSTIEVFDDTKQKSRQDDVEKFMRGDVSPSKKPDMDCIAGLLSLSQGAWR